MNIDALDSETRSRIAGARARSLRNGLLVMPELLAYGGRPGLPGNARAHVWMAAAELQLLDGEAESALRTLDGAVSAAAELSPSLRGVLANNLTVAQFQRRGHVDLTVARALRDEREPISQADAHSQRNLLDALRAARAGKHFEALPLLRSCLAGAYWSGDWQLFRGAASELSAEFLALKDVASAAWWGLLACDDKAMTSVGEACVNSQQPRVVADTLRTLTSHGALRQHAVGVSRFIASASDALPDETVEIAGSFILASMARLPSNESRASWEALERLGGRLSAAASDHVLQAAIASAAWRENTGIDRAAVVRACGAVVGRSSELGLTSFAEAAVQLASPSRRGHDYPDVLELLWRIGSGSETAKQAIAAELFSSSGDKAPAMTMQLAKLFGRELRSADALNDSTKAMAKRVREQVRVEHPSEPQALTDGFGQITFETPEGRVTVQVSNFGPSLEGLLAYSDKIAKVHVDELADALAETAVAKHNLLANRSELISYLGRFGPSMSPDRLPKVAALLLPVARGEIDGLVSTTLGDADDPMNPFRFELGRPEDVQGRAIVALARLSKAYPELLGSAAHEVVTLGLAHTSAKVRQLSYVAATWLSTMSDEIVTGMLIGTRDTDGEAAATALGAFSPAVLRGLSETQTGYLVEIVHGAARALPPKMRRTAASIAVYLRQVQLRPTQARTIDEALALLSGDALYSVRHQVEVSSGRES